MKKFKNPKKWVFKYLVNKKMEKNPKICKRLTMKQF